MRAAEAHGLKDEHYIALGGKEIAPAADSASLWRQKRASQTARVSVTTLCETRTDSKVNLRNIDSFWCNGQVNRFR
jgi:hypothetical protein